MTAATETRYDLTPAGRDALAIDENIQHRLDTEALDQVALILCDQAWGVGMLEDIAELVRATRRRVADHPDRRPTWQRH
jgi:hypothetical protein